VRLWTIGILSLLAGCMGSEALSSSEPPPSSDVNRVSCPISLDAYCAQSQCDRTLDEARQDPQLCGANLQQCGRSFLVKLQNRTLYYQESDLVARVDGLVPGPTSCVTGPATFEVIRCATPESPLQSCAARR
jgi:hypothetical protein